ncbi:MAG: type II secretion system F family protein [Isosphaeraceae bacterium]
MLRSRIAGWSTPREREARRWVLVVPIRQSCQLVFAEAFRQGLAEGLAADQAIRLAAEVNPSRRFRGVLVRMAMKVRSGYPLASALNQTGARVGPALLAALSVGEEYGCLIEELEALGETRGAISRERFRRTIGRSREAARFAAALSRLLRDKPLTVRVVRAGGRVAAAGSKRFSRVIDNIAQNMENGRSFVGALRVHPSHFDTLYCGFLEVAKSREETRTCLERLAGS